MSPWPTVSKYIISTSVFLLSFCFSESLVGQSTSSGSNSIANSSSNSKSELVNESEEVLDTEETLKYIGGRLGYQIKKRLHLTDEEDEKSEKEEQEKAKSAKFSLFGIKIEKH